MFGGTCPQFTTIAQQMASVPERYGERMPATLAADLRAWAAAIDAEADVIAEAGVREELRQEMLWLLKTPGKAVEILTQGTGVVFGEDEAVAWIKYAGQRWFGAAPVAVARAK